MVIIYGLLSFIDYIIYSLAASMFRIIIDIANVEFFKAEQISSIANRIYIVVGVLMLFKLVISAIQYMINPDTFDDKEKGIGGILQKTAISIGLIVIVPSIFNFMLSIQEPIVKSIPNIVFGTDSNVDVDDDKFGTKISFQILSSFVQVREGHEANANNAKISDLESFQKNVMSGCPGVSLFGIFGSYDSCDYNYMIIISTICGGFLCYVLLSMMLDVAIRTIKFGIIQILAPIPISSYVFSKDKLNKFVKTTVSVYVDLFIRMAVIYFIIFAIQNIFNAGTIKEIYDGNDWFRGTIVNIAIIFGLLMFAKNAPKFISELLGLPDVGSGDMADMFKPAWQRAGGAAGALVNPAANAVSNWRQSRRMGRSNGESLRRAVGGFGKGALDSVQGIMAGDDWSKMRSRHELATKRSAQRTARVANYERDQQQTGNKTKRFDRFLKEMGIDRNNMKIWESKASSDYNDELQRIDNQMSSIATQMNSLPANDPSLATLRNQYAQLQQTKNNMLNNKEAWISNRKYTIAARESVKATLTDTSNIIRNGNNRINAITTEINAGHLTDERRAQLEMELERVRKNVADAQTIQKEILSDRVGAIKSRADKIKKYDESISEVESFKVSKNATMFNTFDTYFGGTGSRGKVYLDFADTLAKNRSSIYTGEAMTKMRQNADALIDSETGNPVTHTTQFSSSKYPSAKKTYTYSEISDLLTRAKAGQISETDLHNTYGFENVGMVQSAFEDLEKQFAKDYINANIAAINGTVAGNVTVKLRNPDKMLNSTITEWWDRFEDTILGAGLPPEEAHKYRDEFLKNPGAFIASASDLKEKLTTRGTRYVDAENPKDGK